MKGAIEYLRAVRDICTKSETCKKCPLEGYPACLIVQGERAQYDKMLTDEEITDMVKMVGRIANGTRD